VFVAACASGSSAERDNFKRVMDRQVGKSIDDSDAYPVYYRLKQLNSKQLPNGNTQLVYAAGWNQKCQVGYEVSPIDRKIVKWSIVEGAEECVIYPPRGS
jgi:hypothetical protein